MGLPTKSPRKIKKVPNLQEEFASYELELRTQSDKKKDSAETLRKEKSTKNEKKDVSCASDDTEWAHALLDYAEDRYDAEDWEKVIWRVLML